MPLSSSFIADFLTHNEGMEVPYSNSGASSAAHYALVRNVENAKSSQHAEELLVAEKERVRRRLMVKTLTPVRSICCFHLKIPALTGLM